ncbi:ATP-dependent DNA helicase, RecQ family [Listeria monocytogenes EGD]|uniref:ATP-dependent DNA helicase, RecQ family n=1 Tax=Listeria monocytogenes serotype 1/2a (strain EGD / Mackaness) TaxID=1334565 RepID=A0A3Q0NFV9_LISMG|nr:ATP-dependent DNA helicase, RecQ family [Listeria monocytogenes EGD]
MNLEKELKEYLGFDEFRPGQKEVIETALAKQIVLLCYLLEQEKPFVIN